MSQNDSLRPTEDVVGRRPSAVLWTLGNDLLAQSATVLFVASLILYALSVGSTALRISATLHVLPLVFLALTLGALLKDASILESPEERRFWGDLTGAYACWFLSRAIHWGFPPSTPRAAAEDALYGLFYLGCVMAVERRVHRRSTWLPTRLERLLSWPGVAVFILGLLLYFVFIPLRQDPAAYLKGQFSLHLYVCLDIYLAFTFAYLGWTSPSSRWRTLYRMMTWAVGATLISDLAELLGLLKGWTWGGPWDGLWNVPLLAVILTARARHFKFQPLDSAANVQSTQEGNLSGPSGRTMVMALILPLAHFAGYSSDLLALEHQAPREVLVFGFILVLGSIALVQNQILSHRMDSMSRDREKFEGSLRGSEKDLRFMVERQHTLEQLRRSDLKFFKAFRASPDIMTISTVKDGRFIEVNDSFERVLGHRRDEAVGKTSAELNLWADAEARASMLQILERDGRVKDLEFNFVNRDQEIGQALVSAEIIDLDGKDHVLAVTHDLTLRREIEQQLAVEMSFLQDCDTALVVTDAAFRIKLWNAQAEDRFGWLEAEILERTLADVLGSEANSLFEAAAQCVATSGRWQGDLPVCPRHGEPTEIEAWWSLIGNERRPARRHFLLACRGPAKAPSAEV